MTHTQTRILQAADELTRLHLSLQFQAGDGAICDKQKICAC